MGDATADDIVKWLDTSGPGPDLMRNTATDISTENSWFPGDVPPFTLPRAPLDPVEPQPCAGQFVWVKMVSENPDARAAKIGQHLAKGDAAMQESIAAGCMCHM